MAAEERLEARRDNFRAEGSAWAANDQHRDESRKAPEASEEALERGEHRRERCYKVVQVRVTGKGDAEGYADHDDHDEINRAVLNALGKACSRCALVRHHHSFHSEGACP